MLFKFLKVHRCNFLFYALFSLVNKSGLMGLSLNLYSLFALDMEYMTLWNTKHDVLKVQHMTAWKYNYDISYLSLQQDVCPFHNFCYYNQ